ncbi:hypothetical protein C804_05202 [Lachnospiraceae bacterium A4]|jgi:hypothetical protein|nr:hypothetical protein C804_05202 [Lachnospiraceae bacterium A4]
MVIVRTGNTGSFDTGRGSLMKDMLTYATHGEKKPLGQMVIINGKRSVAYVDKNNEIKSYTTVDEINDLFCKEKVRECELDF